MPRRKRFTVDNGVYHVMARGNNKNNIFHDRDDKNHYKKILSDNKVKYSLKIYHYVLMDNHVHLIINALTGKDLSDSMRRIGVMYSGYYRKKYGGTGHLFQGRFKSFLIQQDRYLLECGRYVELNPVSAGIVKNPLGYAWSSYAAYIGNEDKLVDINPEYLALANARDRRVEIYKEYVESSHTERREEERFFREGFYGSGEYKKRLEENGLKPKWSHSGRPKTATKKKE